jgi:hypothetical protein
VLLLPVFLQGGKETWQWKGDLCAPFIAESGQMSVLIKDTILRLAACLKYERARGKTEVRWEHY